MMLSSKLRRPRPSDLQDDLLGTLDPRALQGVS